MAVFDNNWISAWQYVIAHVETDFRWNLIEANPHMGIGIYQASNEESWELLHKLVTEYPEHEQYFDSDFLATFKSGSSWGRKVFTNSQANQIRKALATKDSRKVQMELFNSFASRYISVMKKYHVTNNKGALFASTIYHQSPRAFFQIHSSVGNGTYIEWYRGALNNGIVGKYKTRQNKVLADLEKWDGSSYMDFGQGGTGGNTSNKDWDADDIGDEDPKDGNPAETYADTVTKLGISYLRQEGRELWLQLDETQNNQIIRFYKNGNNLWIPYHSSTNVGGQTKNDNIQQEPTDGNQAEPTVDGVQGKIIATMKSLEGKVSYTQGQGERMTPNEGTADCSGLTWYCYHVHGYNIGTWTGTQRKNGKQIHGGRCSQWKDSFEDDLKPADLIVMQHDGGGGHVEMYMDRKGYVMGIGSAKVKGSRWRTISNLMSSFDSYTVRRIIKD